MVTIKVLAVLRKDMQPGELVSICVYKHLICHFSPFFAAAFNSDFVEGQTQIMILEDVWQEGFGDNLYVHPHDPHQHAFNRTH